MNALMSLAFCVSAICLVGDFPQIIPMDECVHVSAICTKDVCERGRKFAQTLRSPAFLDL